MNKKRSYNRRSKKRSYNRRSKKRSYKRRSKKRSRKMSTRDKCKKYLQKKIKENLGEYKRGRYVSRKQAIAVSYSQAKSKYPRCRSIFK